MKTILSQLGLVFLLLAFAHDGAAQSDYNTALGLRFSSFYGFTVKHFINQQDAVEGILHTRWNAFKLTGLWERHVPAFDEPGLYAYYGGGAHIGIANERYYGRYYEDGRSIIGIDGILGLEYNIQDPSVPVQFGLDWKPALNLAPYSGFFGSELALSVRYMFR
jgi:hypothetical protein